VLRNLLLHEFAGPVYPVNRRAEHVAGVRAYASPRRHRPAGRSGCRGRPGRRGPRCRGLRPCGRQGRHRDLDRFAWINLPSMCRCDGGRTVVDTASSGAVDARVAVGRSEGSLPGLPQDIEP
jgi:hypothetical protein